MAKRATLRPAADKLSKLSLRAYLVLRDPALAAIYGAGTITTACTAVENFLRLNAPAIFQAPRAGLTVEELPSRPYLLPAPPTDLVVRILMSPGDLPFFYALANSPTGRIGPLRIVGFGIDARVGASGHIGNGFAGNTVFSSREQADHLIRTDALRKGGKLLTGRGVNLALIDSGLDDVEQQRLGLNVVSRRTGTEHDRYLPEATPPPRYDHAFAMATLIRRLAPDVKLHDYAVIPPRVSRATIPAVAVRVSAFLSDVVGAYIDLRDRIKVNGASPWVIMNAWSVHHRTWEFGTDLDLPNAYLNGLISEIATLGADVVFAAGNCGQFAPDIRCVRADLDPGLNRGNYLSIGPGFGIVSPNGHPSAITVGAVTDAGLWIGASSQGPDVTGPLPQAAQKPDIVAPSNFFDLAEPGRIFSGASTACAMTAAAVAAMREGWPGPQFNLKSAMIRSARKMDQTGWNERTGHGILDIQQTIANLPP